MVAMNPQTWEGRRRDRPAATCSTTHLAAAAVEASAPDITVLGVPLTEMCNATFRASARAQLFKNIAYVGALAALLDMDRRSIAKLLGEKYKGKKSCSTPTEGAAHLGYDYAKEHFDARSAAVRSSRWTRRDASSSTATPPRRSAASTAARPSAPGIRSRRRRR
jgi:2-oxoglutarate ferredoxin oxidoreductase subunit alpha